MKNNNKKKKPGCLGCFVNTLLVIIVLIVIIKVVAFRMSPCGGFPKSKIELGTIYADTFAEFTISGGDIYIRGRKMGRHGVLDFPWGPLTRIIYIFLSNQPIRSKPLAN